MRYVGTDGPLESQHLLITVLVPPVVKLLLQELEREVDEICGARHEHGKVIRKHGDHDGSAVIAS